MKQKYYLRAVEKTDKAVSLLYSLGAAEVYIFGSLLHPEVFDEMSDVDIYVQGLTQEKRKGLFTSLEEIFGEITFDLLFDDDSMRPEIIEKIKKEGKLWKPS
ncbi:MAG: hypothetical protein Kow00102_13130 [Spirochaetota bacterium]